MKYSWDINYSTTLVPKGMLKLFLNRRNKSRVNQGSLKETTSHFKEIQGNFKAKSRKYGWWVVETLPNSDCGQYYMQKDQCNIICIMYNIIIPLYITETAIRIGLPGR